MINLWKFQYTPPWAVTRWGLMKEHAFKLQDGCDEWHNESKLVVIPLLGMFVWFQTINRKGPEHLYAMSCGDFFGLFDPDCKVCVEIMADFTFYDRK